MERILGRVAGAYQDEPSFGGVAIHCYYSYKFLTRGGNVPTKERPEDIYTIFSYNRGIIRRIKIDGNLSDWSPGRWGRFSPYVIEHKDNVVYGRKRCNLFLFQGLFGVWPPPFAPAGAIDISQHKNPFQ